MTSHSTATENFFKDPGVMRGTVSPSLVRIISRAEAGRKRQQSASGRGRLWKVGRVISAKSTSRRSSDATI